MIKNTTIYKDIKENTLSSLNLTYSKNISFLVVPILDNVNKNYFCSAFKKETGYTFTNFLNMMRVERSKRPLMDKNNSILDVALSVGYNNHNYYTTTFKKLNRNTPLEYRNNVLFKSLNN